MKFELLDQYILDTDDDSVYWLRVFPREMKMLSGKGVYRDDVLILLFPIEVHGIKDLTALREPLGFGSLPVWDKTAYVIHMGNASQSYPIQAAIETETGRELTREEVDAIVERIEQVFPS